MRTNANVVLVGSKCALVPYTREHVELYHHWMQSPVLQELTASEPLSMEEEYEMQASWRDDEDKLTFIILDRDWKGSREGDEASPAPPPKDAPFGRMVGDVNLFFNDHEDPKAAEVELMIAEPAARRRGLGREAVEAMFAYAVRELGATLFRTKIGEDNEPSLRLFRDMGFKDVSYSTHFKEFTLELPQQAWLEASWGGARGDTWPTRAAYEA